jgi:tetratricopeptide (TPR) repeat protein
VVKPSYDEHAEVRALRPKDCSPEDHRLLASYRRRVTDLLTWQLFDNALSLALEGLERYPRFEPMFLHAGLAHLGNGRFSRALTFMAAAVDLDSEDVDARLLLSISLLLMNKPVEALQEVNITLAMSPLYATAWSERSSVRRYLGQYVSALDDATAAITMDDCAAHRLERARVNLEAGRPGLALDDLYVATRLEPERSEVYQVRAAVSERLGNRHAARKDRAHARRLDVRVQAQAPGTLMRRFYRRIWSVIGNWLEAIVD